MKSVLAVRHVAFEHLGAFEAPLRAAGYAVHYRDVGAHELRELDAHASDLVVILGGPLGVYEEDAYPFLRDEIAFVARRLESGRPLMGICLGAQLIARAAGSRVYPSGVKEIGFAPITLTAAGAVSCLAPFAADGTTLHWHGDTFDLPAGAELLASTELCRNQAFAMGRNVVAFQFHPEAGAGGFEQWLVGHACELAAARIDVATLRADAERFGASLATKAADVLTRWLAGLAG